MDLSIVIVNYHNSHTLADCLESVFKTVQGIEFEVIVVNNSARDAGLETIENAFSQVQRIRNPINKGFAKANNQGVEISRGETLLFLNPDTVLTDNSIMSMFRFLKDHADIGVLGPKLLNPDGSLQYSCRRFPTLWSGLFNRYSLLTRLFPENRFTTHYLMTDFDHNETREVDWLSGSCMMASREVFSQAGKFDEKYFLFNEDVDLCQSMKQLGLKVVYYPSACVYHRISSSNSQLDPRIIMKRHQGMSYYYHKHLNGRGAPRFLVDILVALRCLSQLLLNIFK